MSIDTPSYIGGALPPLSGLPEYFSGDDADDVFRHLYAEHSQGVYGLAWRICGSSFAGDITQEVFLSLWKNPDRFDPIRGSLHSLLLTMAHGKAIDIVRSETARRGREKRSASAEPMSDVGDEEFDKNTASLITLALDRLPAKEKEAIVTAFYGDCTYREAALVLGQPEGTIKARIRKGMARMRFDLGSLN
jgi:RNA polymerase sigma-70 factor (ECF subfamily)